MLGDELLNENGLLGVDELLPSSLVPDGMLHFWAREGVSAKGVWVGGGGANISQSTDA